MIGSPRTRIISQQIPILGLNTPKMGVSFAHRNLLTSEVVALKRASVKESAGKYSLADALFTTTQQKLFSLLFGQPGRSFYLTELVKLAKVGSGGVQRELSRLEQTGLVTATAIGNQKHYQANPESPLFTELTGIVKKTVGLKQPLLVALEPLQKKISLALVYGSVAKATDTSSSDIDLMIVSDELAMDEVCIAVAVVESELGRQVNPTLYNSAEFNKKRKAKTGFLVKVLSGPVIELIGSVDD